MKALPLLCALFAPLFSFPQSDIEKVMRGSEILLSGLTILKMARSNEKTKNPKTVEMICVRNKLAQKITFRITGTDAQENEIRKELVIPNDGKECLFNFPKITCTYEFVLATGEIYKKGEYKIEDEVTFTVKDP